MSSERPSFLLDAHLGRLARYLRMLGFDARYEKSASDDAIVDILRQDRRILLSRDRQLLGREFPSERYFVEAEDARGRLAEVVDRFDLCAKIDSFTRCMVCNERLRGVEKETVADRLPPDVRDGFDVFQQCPSCGRTYWKGSHYERMCRLIDQICG